MFYGIAEFGTVDVTFAVDSPRRMVLAFDVDVHVGVECKV